MTEAPKTAAYELTAEGKHGWEIKYKARVKESDLAETMADLYRIGGVLRVVVRTAPATCSRI